MSFPFFYIDGPVTNDSIILNEETSKHIAQVLRMQNGEQLNLTDGNGNLYTASISDNNKKKCIVAINSKEQIPKSSKKIIIAVSILKNATRFEWFLEKATEIGISEIIPLLCERTERTHFRHDRMKSILMSAMLQSQQVWLPLLQEPKQFDDLVISQFDDCDKFIAHCEEDKKQSLSNHQITKSSNQLILIGPEGDFTKEEIELALKNNFIPVTLGNTRLRSETAGMVAAVLLMAHS